MAHSVAIAKKSAEVLNSIGHSCTCVGSSFTLTNWGVRIDVDEGREKQDPSVARVFTNIVARHRWLPRGFARELAVGMASTVEEAADNISASWILLFFPLLKFIFDEQPHDCLVLERPIVLPRAEGASYFLTAGPVRSMGREGASDHQHFGQTLLFDAFASRLLPNLPPGAHHIRCFAGRGIDTVNGDVFVDGREWPEGSALLRALAEKTLPVPDESYPMCALKQHLFIRPADVVKGTRAAIAAQVSDWHEAIAPRIAKMNQPVLTSVLRALAVMCRFGTEEQHASELLAAGESPRSCEDLIAFVQSAAARVVIGDRLTLSPTYYWSNYQTRRAVEKRYDQTPVYVAAVEAYALLNTAELAGEEIRDLALTSAECRVWYTAREKNISPEKAHISAMFHPTDEVFDGEDLDALLKPTAPSSPAPKPESKKKKPWWKRW